MQDSLDSVIRMEGLNIERQKECKSKTANSSEDLSLITDYLLPISLRILMRNQAFG